jgi:LysM repeat protein
VKGRPIKHGDLATGQNVDVQSQRGYVRYAGEFDPITHADGTPGWLVNDDSSFAFRRLDGTVAGRDQLQSFVEYLQSTGTDTSNLSAKVVHSGKPRDVTVMRQGLIVTPRDGTAGAAGAPAAAAAPAAPGGPDAGEASASQAQAAAESEGTDAANNTSTSIKQRALDAWNRLRTSISDALAGVRAKLRLGPSQGATDAAQGAENLTPQPAAATPEVVTPEVATAEPTTTGVVTPEPAASAAATPAEQNTGAAAAPEPGAGEVPPGTVAAEPPTTTPGTEIALRTGSEVAIPASAEVATTDGAALAPGTEIPNSREIPGTGGTVYPWWYNHAGAIFGGMVATPVVAGAITGLLTPGPANPANNQNYPTYGPLPPINTGIGNPDALPGAINGTTSPGASIAVPTVLPGSNDKKRQPTTYTVVAGDSLSAIAQRSGVSLAALEAANPQITDPNLIYVGNTVNIPPPGTAANTYLINPGDTLSAIAQRYGTTVDALAQANGIADPNVIYIGGQLVVPNQPAAAAN